jgi:hypothetical protein
MRMYLCAEKFESMANSGIVNHNTAGFHPLLGDEMPEFEENYG